jgi:hypothetical protein
LISINHPTVLGSATRSAFDAARTIRGEDGDRPGRRADLNMQSGRPLPATRRNGYLIFADRRKSRNLEKRNSDVNAARSGEHKYVDFRQLADSEDELNEEIRYLFI